MSGDSANVQATMLMLDPSYRGLKTVNNHLQAVTSKEKCVFFNLLERLLEMHGSWWVKLVAKQYIVLYYTKTLFCVCFNCS